MGAAHSIFGHSQRPVSSSYVTKQPDGRIYKCTTIQLCCKSTDVVSTELQPESLTLEDRVQSLPQELHDMILKFVVDIPTNQTIVVDDNYNPPPALWLNKSLRTSTAQAYFTTNSFLFSNTNPEFFYDWLQGMHPDHCALLTDIRFQIYDKVSGSRLDKANDIAGWLSRCLKHLDKDYPEVNWTILKVDWRVKGEVSWRNWSEMLNTSLRMYLRGLDV